jgi:hypothetical protein
MDGKYEQDLLNIIKKNLECEKGSNVEEKLKNYVKSKYNTKNIEIFQALQNIVNKDEIIDNDFLGLKITICKIFVNCLNKKDYNQGDLVEELISSKDLKLRKRIKIAFLLSYLTQKSIYQIFFFILNEQKFKLLTKILNYFSACSFNNNKELNDKIDTIDEKEIDNLINKEVLSNNDITNLFTSIDELYQYISPENKQKQCDTKFSSKNLEKNTNNCNESEKTTASSEINQKIKEKEKDMKLNKERKERIFRLINESIKINDKFKDLNNNDIFQNDDMEDISEKDLSIDDFQIRDKKIYLFSPIFLIINNLKSEFEKNDFEIFNKDNNYIEVFGNYLEKIIEKLNNFINKGEESEYIEENAIKFGCYKTHYYLCCKFNDQFKMKYYDAQKITESHNWLINNKDKKEEIEVLKIKKNKKKEELLSVSQPKEEKKEDKKEDNISISSAKISIDNQRNVASYNLENEVKEIICDPKNCESLQNLIFFFNLKILKKDNNKINMKSVVLIFNNKPLGTLYGFREIDICLKNKIDRTIEIFINKQILKNNLIYKINNNGKFKKQKEQPIDVSLSKNSIIFCEVKNSFPYITIGAEKFDIIKYKKNKENDNSLKENNNNNNISFTYIDHLANLFKKSQIFFDFFLRERIFNCKDLFHIIYLYDESNISDWKNDFETIEESINTYLCKINIPTNFKNVIFQIAYFNKEEYLSLRDKEQKENIIKLKKTVEEKTANIINLEQKVEEDTAKIENLEQKVEEDTAKIENLEQKVEEDTAKIKNLEQKAEEDTAKIKNLEQKAEEDTAKIKMLEDEIKRLKKLKIEDNTVDNNNKV